MAASNPTIIVGHLNDQELKSSIDKLVNHIDQQTKKMADSFDSAITRMKSSLQSLGATKVDFGGSNDGGSSRRTSSVQREIQARKELNTTLDQQAVALEKVTAPKSARDSYMAFFQGYKQQAQELQQYITSFERGLNAAIGNRVNELTTQLSQSKERIRQLNEELNRLHYAAGNPQATAQIQAQLDKELRTHNQIQSALANVNQEYAIEKAYLASLYAEHHKISNMMRDDVQTKQQSATVTQQQTQDIHRQTEEIRKQAQAIRESKEWQTTGTAIVGDRVVYANDRQKRTLEEQLLQIQKDIVNEKEKQARAEQNEIAAKQAEETAARRQLELEREITRTVEQRKKYTAPTAYSGFEITQNSLTNYIAQHAKIDRANVVKWDEERSSLKTLTTALNQYKTAYANMSAMERNSPFGQQMISDMQVLERTIKRVKTEMSTMSRDTIKNLPTNTLEQIAYKMQQLSTYRSGLDINKQAEEIRQVNKEYDSLKKKMDDVMQKNQSMVGSNNALARSWNYMKNRLAFYFTVGASTQFVRNLIDVRSQYEMNERALGILIDSAERGTQIFKELSQMSLVSPYTLIELSTAAKQLTAYDVAARDVVDTTKRLADMASAVGIPVERLTYALGQIKAYGYLNSRDARMFSNAGIPLVKQLAEYYSELEDRMVSTADIYDRIKKKTIGYGEVMNVITRMTDEGGKFFDFQAKMADTLKVRLANFTLAWNNMLNDIGASNQGIIVSGLNGLTKLLRAWRDLERMVYNVAIAFGVVKAAQILYINYTTKVGFATAAADVANKKLVASIYALNNGIKALIANPMTWWMLLATVVVSAGFAFYDAYQKVKEFNEAIRKGAEENRKNIKEYLDGAKAIRDSLYEVQTNKNGDILRDEGGRSLMKNVNINKDDAGKAWEAMREQIELSTAASDVYIKKLLQINDVSQRLREGFALLDDIQAVNAALENLDSTTLGIPQQLSAWWNLDILPDGLIKNLQQTSEEFNKIRKNAVDVNTVVDESKTITLDAAKAYPQYGRELEAFRKDLEVTTKSIERFISAQGFANDPTAITEIWSQALKKIVTDNQLDPQQAYILQYETEKARSEAMRNALDARIADEKNALAVARNEESKAEIEQRLATLEEERALYAKELDETRPIWDDFTKYVKDRHISEIRMMFKGMNEEEIKSLNFREGEYGAFVKRMVEGYAKSHKMTYDDAFNYLKNWVSKANLWSIFIKLNIGTEEDKTALQLLQGYDAEIDKADAAIERLQKRENELLQKQKKTRKEEEELNKITAERGEAEKTKAENEAKGGHGKKEEKDAKAAAKDAKKHASSAARSAREAESELQKTLKNELSLIEKIRNVYQSLTKEGASHTDALDASTKGFEETIKSINDVFAKWGIKGFDAKLFAGASNPRMLVNLLESQLNTIISTGRAKQSEIKDLEVKIQDLKIDAQKYDLKKITDGLNNELSKLKDEYELAIELDANPELGNLFADMWGINTETLPHTVKEYADEYTKLVNKYLKENKAGLELPTLDLTDDDLRTFEEMVNTQAMNEEWYKVIVAGVKAVRGARKKDYEDTAKEWNKLIDKYGGLQAQLLKIFKDTTKEQIDIIRKFGDDDEVKQALQLQASINLSTDANEITRLSEQLKVIRDRIAAKNPQASNLFGAIQNKQGRESSKAYWDDFKESELYSMTFEDMEHVSTRAIRAIVTQLDLLKDKVKEDPASMKALIKSMEDAEAELITRNPFASIVTTFKEWRTAASQAREAQLQLKDANREVARSENELKNAQDANDIGAVEIATLKLIKAKEKQKTASANATRKENAAIKARKKFADSCKAGADALNNLSSLMQQFTDMMGVVEDSDTDVAIQSITKALGAMSAALGFASAMILVLNTEMPYLAAIAAILAVIVAGFSFLSGQKDAKITRQIKESERAIKRLENTYKNLEDTAENAYGAIVSGAKKAIQANKELQLVELKRQLELEKSRSKKKRDKDKILDLEGQIIELRNEIKNASQDIINDMLGISSAGDGIEGLVGSMIEAFRNGEDAMKAFGDKWDEMIDNMILKLLVSHYMQQAWDKVMADLAAQEDAMLSKYSQDKANAQQEFDRISAMTDEELAKEIADKMGKSAEYKWMGWRPTAEMMAAYRKAAESALTSTTQTLNDASYDYTQWSFDYMNHEGRDYMLQYAQMLKDSLGEWYTYGENNEKSLSALQQGITGITEDTAGALEAYMNGVSQQVYLQSDLLTQIRDAVVMMNTDVQLGVMSQVLLQLQNSYQVQMTIQSTLNGWSNPSGQAVRVELM